MRVVVYVEGPGDRDAMKILLAPFVEELAVEPPVTSPARGPFTC